MECPSKMVEIHAPMRGIARSLEGVDDPVFAGRLVGEGVAIEPLDEVVRAPFHGTIVALAETGHSITIRSDEGVDLLIHVGIDTVQLKGRGFRPVVAAGQAVALGDPLIELDLDLLAQHAASLMTPVIVTSPHPVAALASVPAMVGAGQRLMVASVEAAAAASPAEAELARSTTHISVQIDLPHGLHARPSGKLAELARAYGGTITVAIRDRVADASSVTSLMSLGARFGDEIGVRVVGEGSRETAIAVADLLDRLAKAERTDLAPPTPSPAVAAGTATLALSRSSLKAVIASPGLASGKVFRLARHDPEVAKLGRGGPIERERLRAAIIATAGDLEAIMAGATGAASAIAEAHLGIVTDLALQDAADQFVLSGFSAEYAWRSASRRQEAALSATDDPRIRDRAIDLRDVERRVLGHLSGGLEESREIPPDAVIICDDIEPSVLLGLPRAGVAAICTARGGATSHAAILAAARGIPMLVAAGDAVLALVDDADIIVDAVVGLVDVAPSKAAIAEVARRVQQDRETDRAARQAALQPCRLTDGTRVEVFANLATPADADDAVANGAEGCGLLRTEFIFAEASEVPDEHDQTEIYRTFAERLQGRPLIVRTLDAGGDKPIAYLPFPPEDNPALGLRGIRFTLSRPDLLRTQLRAMLRSVPASQLRIMLPMIVEADEIAAARAMLQAEAADLGVSGTIQLGIMVETPAAVLSAARLAEQADFLSIGTNDLSQYVLAMDRGNAALASRVDSFHPAVLRAVAMTAEGAATRNRWLGVCGGLASDYRAAPLLVGLGCHELSSVPGAVPRIKQTLARWSMADCRELAARALAMASASQVRELVAGEVQ